MALPGRCRGDLLGPWGDNLTRRFGADAVARVRRRLPAPLAQLGARPSDRDWVPAWAQITLTEAIVDEFLGGDLVALFPLLVEDTRHSLGRIQLAVVRAMEAGRAFKLAPGTLPKGHEPRGVEVEVEGRRARLVFRGTPLFEHPSWRVLQLHAQRTLMDLTGTPGQAVGEDVGPEAFVVTATW